MENLILSVCEHSPQVLLSIFAFKRAAKVRSNTMISSNKNISFSAMQIFFYILTKNLSHVVNTGISLIAF